MGLLKALFIFVWVTFPLGVLIRISPVANAYVYPVDVAVLLFVLYGLYLSISRTRFSWYKPIIPFLILALISLLFNLYWLNAREFFIGLLYLLRLALFASIFPVILQFSKKETPFLMWTIIISLFSTVIMGIAQYFLYPDLRNLMYLGWDEHLYRIFSSFLDPNFAAGIFVLLFWITILFVRSFEHERWKKIVLIGIAGLTFIAIMFTYSRTGYLMLIVSAIIYLAIEKKFKVLILGLALFLASLIFIPKDLQSEGVNLFRTASVFSRIESYTQAVSVFQKSPVFGVGYNTYRYAQAEFLGRTIEESSHAGAGVSNSFLFVLATTGIAGFVAFLYFLAKTFSGLIKNSGFANGMIAFVTALIIGSLTENMFFYSFVLIIFWSIVGLAQKITGGKQP